MDTNKSDMWQTVAVATAIVLVVAAVMAGIVAWVVAVQKSNVGRVEACTSNGGSWVAGPLGFECRQEGSQ